MICSTMLRDRTFLVGRGRLAAAAGEQLRMLVWGMTMLLLLGPSSVSALKHSFHAHHAKSLIGPVGAPFGFLRNGHYEINVYNFELLVNNRKSGKEEVDPTEFEPGFFLQRFENEAAFNHHLELLKSNTSLCSFQYFRDEDDGMDFSMGVDDDLEFDDKFFSDNTNVDIESAERGILLSMKSQNVWKQNKPTTIEYRFKKGEEGLYFLLYQVCPYDPSIVSNFELDFHFDNTDAFGNENFLSAGEMKLPGLFFFFAISYLICFVVWFTNIREIQQGRDGHFYKHSGRHHGGNSRPMIYRIHHLMSVLVLLKFLTVLFESIRYHVIRVSGHAEVWTFLYYAFSFVKGTFLFTVILLIGTGWSFVKPFLNDREKRIIFVVLVLQVINNLALIFLSQESEGEARYARWAGLLHIVDIICCCVVLVPLVWQVNELEKTVDVEDSEDPQDLEEREMALEMGDKGEILSKLKLFRAFYLLVVAYIYSTRILVYLFATLLDYQHIWVRHFVVELVTLSFYVAVGMMFRPKFEHKYVGIKKEEDGVNGHGLEMASRKD